MAGEGDAGHAIVGFGELDCRHCRYGGNVALCAPARREWPRVPTRGIEHGPERAPPLAFIGLVGKHAVEGARFGEVPQGATVESRSLHDVLDGREGTIAERGFQFVLRRGPETAHAS